ncbi:hypothetical protein PIROE2DRAFT_65024 [Piromyces sp. E2]|nr:hypothetical protein PIROE2DRAFT_65024 [Piromyces sp. E2]|eukprot:OUM57412.1 hypothetical protein PIROE2DRAFT_65024 [Piromyces sp. E2]
MFIIKRIFDIIFPSTEKADIVNIDSENTDNEYTDSENTDSENTNCENTDSENEYDSNLEEKKKSQQLDPFIEKVKHLPEEKIYEKFWKVISRGDINEMDSFQDEEGKILVDINRRNKEGDTALFIASENGNLKAVK